MKSQHTLSILILLFLLTGGTSQTIAQEKKDSPKVLRLVKKLGNLLDTMAVKGIDRKYIDVPEKPWQFILRGNINQSYLKMKATIDASSMFTNTVGDLKWEPRIKTSPATYAGFWVGYRGYGFGYSWNVGGDKGRILTFGATGGCYGINLRIHTFDTNEPDVHYEGRFIPESSPDSPPVYESNTRSAELPSPISTRTIMVDGYYLFNSKRFSYAAAYDQSAIQKRSAGSLMAGAMYYHSHINYATDDNAAFILLMDNIGRIKQWQVSAGVGYAYNWVPCKGLLINAMVMPMLTFYNRHKTWRYDSNYRDLAMDVIVHHEDELQPEDYRLKEEPLSVVDRNSNITLNYDARLSLTYQWQRFFINAYGQYSNFHHSDGGVRVSLHDWYVNAALGIRF